jgi:hypothetical protein
MHQVDLDIASGRNVELSARIAADGVDEVLTVMLPRMAKRGHRAVLTAPLQLVAADTGDSWMVAPAADGPPRVSREAAPRADPQDRVVAPADVLYRALWHRRFEQRELRISGDEPRVRDFLGSRLTP